MKTSTVSLNMILSNKDKKDKSLSPVSPTHPRSHAKITGVSLILLLITIFCIISHLATSESPESLEVAHPAPLARSYDSSLLYSQVPQIIGAGRWIRLAGGEFAGISPVWSEFMVSPI